MKRQHPVSTDQLKALLVHARDLDVRDRRIVVRRVAATPNVDLAEPLLALAAQLTWSADLIGEYAEALVATFTLVNSSVPSAAAGVADVSSRTRQDVAQRLLEAALSAEEQRIALRTPLLISTDWDVCRTRVEKLRKALHMSVDQLATRPEFDGLRRAVGAALTELALGRASFFGGYGLFRLADVIGDTETCAALLELLEDWRGVGGRLREQDSDTGVDLAALGYLFHTLSTRGDDRQLARLVSWMLQYRVSSDSSETRVVLSQAYGLSQSSRIEAGARDTLLQLCSRLKQDIDR